MKKAFYYLPAAMLFAAFLLLAPQSHAQLHVATDGDVGIGTTSPSSKLDVYTTGTSTYRGIENYNYYSGSTSKYGLYNYLSSAGTGGRYGLYTSTYGNSGSTSSTYGTYNYLNSYANYLYGTYNYAYTNGGSGTKYGLYTRLYCGSSDGTGSRYALYSSSGCTGGYAGYFQGDVYIAGNLTTTSDASKKTNVETLNGGLDIITQLKPKTYDYKTAENPQLPTEKQYGFIAQELAQVMPDLVKDVETFVESDELNEDGTMKMPEPSGTISTVNYMALIPVLVKGMQEQQETIDAQQAALEAQAAQIQQLQQQIDNR